MEKVKKKKGFSPLVLVVFFGQFLSNNKIITTIIITTITTKQIKKGRKKKNYRVFGFLRISLVTCNENKMGKISRFGLNENKAVQFWYGNVERRNAFTLTGEGTRQRSDKNILQHKLTQ